MKIGFMYVNLHEINYFTIDWDEISKLNDKVHFYFKNGDQKWTSINRDEAIYLDSNCQFLLKG
jgi:hypothetical protein